MKEETELFNPLPLPDNLIEAVHQEIKAVTKPETKSKRRVRRKPAIRVPEVVVRRVRKPKLSIARIKTRLSRKLSQLDTSRLKRLLVLCGVGIALATSIVLLARFAPIVLVLIAVLGLAWLLSHSQTMINWRRI